MGTQRSGGTGSTRSNPAPRAPQPQKMPVAEGFADSLMWHTRGLQANSRMRVPATRRTPPRQLPPSPLPRLVLWAAVIAVALVCFQAVKHLLR